MSNEEKLKEILNDIENMSKKDFKALYNSVKNKHPEMDFNFVPSTELLTNIYEYEKEKAFSLETSYDNPKRYSSFSRAASLALLCNDIPGFKILVSKGLEGDPPEDIKKIFEELVKEQEEVKE